LNKFLSQVKKRKWACFLRLYKILRTERLEYQTFGGSPLFKRSRKSFSTSFSSVTLSGTASGWGTKAGSK
jgi:hypothetical protein